VVAHEENIRAADSTASKTRNFFITILLILFD